MTKFKKTPFYPLLLLLCLGTTWGTSFSIARFAMENGITPLGYLFWQTVGPAVLLYLIIFFIQKKSFILNKKQILFYIATGLLCILLPNYVMFRSALHIPSGTLGLIVNTSPIITYLLSILFFIEKFEFKRFLGILCGFLGLYFLFSSQVNFEKVSTPWILFAFLTPFLLAFSTVFVVKYKDEKINSLELSCGMLITASVLTVPMTFYYSNFHPIVAFNAVNGIILLEILLASLGFVLFFELLRISGPVYYSLVSCIVALSAFGWGYLVFHESLRGTETVAVLLTVFAIYLVSAKNKG